MWPCRRFQKYMIMLHLNYLHTNTASCQHNVVTDSGKVLFTYSESSAPSGFKWNSIVLLSTKVRNDFCTYIFRNFLTEEQLGGARFRIGEYKGYKLP